MKNSRLDPSGRANDHPAMTSARSALLFFSTLIVLLASSRVSPGGSSGMEGNDFREIDQILSSVQVY